AAPLPDGAYFHPVISGAWPYINLYRTSGWSSHRYRYPQCSRNPPPSRMRLRAIQVTRLFDAKPRGNLPGYDTAYLSEPASTIWTGGWEVPYARQSENHS